jgi:hypothetical protein
MVKGRTRTVTEMEDAAAAITAPEDGKCRKGNYAALLKISIQPQAGGRGCGLVLLNDDVFPLPKICFAARATK